MGSLTEVFASDGKTRLGFIQSDDLVRPVPSTDFPDVLKQATVAIEDERFYKHKGVDYEGIIRAAVKNATAKGKTVQGGSTLTMQLVRLLYTQDDTREGLAGYERKIKEAKLARDLEAQVLQEVGRRQVPELGALRHGRRPVRDRRRRRGPAVLQQAGPRTSRCARRRCSPACRRRRRQYSPVLNPQGTKARRNEVLGKMAELGYITRERAEREKRKDLGLNMKDYFQKARERYVLDYVQSELIKEYGAETVKRGGFKVYTTIDLKKQQEARAAIADRMGNVGPSSAIVSIRPSNGDIVAMASSQEYGKSKFNLAAQGHRQPGSSFKIMTLLTALRLGVDPNSTTYSSKGTMTLDDPPCGSPASPWEVKTYSGSGGGTMNLVRGTLASDNIVYAQLASDLGPDKVKETARMMGIKSKLNGFCAETLGGLEDGVSPLEMSSAYATIANGGYRNRPRAIKKIVARGQDAQAPQALARAPREGLRGRRDLRGDEDPRAEHPGRHGHARRDRLPGRRQDRHHRQEHRRLVRRLHAAAVDRGLGRLPGRRAPVDERHVPRRAQHRRRHLPGRHLGHLHEAGRRLLLRRLQAPDRAVPQPAVPGPLRRARAARTTRRSPATSRTTRDPRARHRDRTRERHARQRRATPTAAATTTRPTTAATATTARPSTRTSTKPRRRARPRPEPRTAARKRPRRVAALSLSCSGLVQLAPSEPPAGGESVREGSAAAAVLAHAGSRGVAVRWLPVS